MDLLLSWLPNLQSIWQYFYDSELILVPGPEIRPDKERLVAPIRDEENTYAWLQADMPANASPTAQSLLQSWADLLGQAIGKKQVLDNMTNELIMAWESISFLNRIAGLIRSTTDPWQIAVESLGLASETIEAKNAFVCQLIDGDLRFQWIGPDYGEAEARAIIAALENMDKVLICNGAETCGRVFPDILGLDSFLGRKLQVTIGPTSFIGLINKSGGGFSAGDIQLFESLTEQIMSVIEVAALHEERLQTEKLSRDLVIAAEVQSSFLPRELPDIPGYKMAAQLISASKVGGDFYYLCQSEGMTGLMVCDVAGKGISAALLAAEIRFATRLETQQCLRFPGKVLQGVNAKLYDDLKRTERFATAMLVSVPEHETVLYYANAGHTTALWLQTDPLDVKHLPSQTLPLGVLPHIEDISVPIELKPNDVLVMYSDGLLEAENEQGQILGLTELKGVLLAARSTPTQFILDSLLKTYREHRGDAPITDDLTLLVLKQKAASTQTAKYLIRLRWPSDFSVLPDVETKLNRLRSYLPKTNQTHIWLSEIQLALTEVVTNIIKYSYRQNTGIIHGLIALYADRLQIDFFDFGEPYQPRDLPPLNFDPTDPPSGGYGLYIIHNVMDNVIYTRLPVECNHWHFTRTLPVEELDSGGIP